MTKPACTPLVSAACANPDSRNSATSAGTTADAENHSAIAATWQSAMIAIDASFGRSPSGHCRFVRPRTTPAVSDSRVLRSWAA